VRGIEIAARLEGDQTAVENTITTTVLEQSVVVGNDELLCVRVTS
jgi:hypothetical protein